MEVAVVVAEVELEVGEQMRGGRREEEEGEGTRAGACCLLKEGRP